MNRLHAPVGFTFRGLLVLVVLALAACDQMDVRTSQPDIPLPTTEPTAVPSPTATSVPDLPPTEAPRTFMPYHHPSGVFSISRPDDWELLDDSSEQRLTLRLIPPVGFGSRAIVEITNQGQIDTAEVDALVESYIHLFYSGNSAYTEAERTATENGYRALFLYDDAAGGVGQEAVIFRYEQPYFAALRVFLAERDIPYLSQTLAAIENSLVLDPQAEWGGTAASVNPAELVLTNTTLWKDDAGVTYYTGELYNASPAAVTELRIRVAFCNAAGVIQAEASEVIPPALIGQGELIPFAIAVDDLPDEIEVCSAQVSAEPAPADSGYTTAFGVTLTTDYNQWRKDLALTGEIKNLTLIPAYDLAVLVAVYDSDNRVIGYALIQAEMEKPLSPGQSVPFEYLMTSLGGVPDHLVTLAQGRAYGEANPSLIPTALP